MIRAHWGFCILAMAGSAASAQDAFNEQMFRLKEEMSRLKFDMDFGFLPQTEKAREAAEKAREAAERVRDMAERSRDAYSNGIQALDDR